MDSDHIAKHKEFEDEIDGWSIAKVFEKGFDCYYTAVFFCF